MNFFTEELTMNGDRSCVAECRADLPGFVMTFTGVASSMCWTDWRDGEWGALSTQGQGWVIITELLFISEPGKRPVRAASHFTAQLHVLRLEHIRPACLQLQRWFGWVWKYARNEKLTMVLILKMVLENQNDSHEQMAEISSSDMQKRKKQK